MTIYADMLFLVNFIINIILLKLCCLLIKTASSALRLTAASALGAVYAVCMFFPDISFFYIFPFKLAVSFFMIKIVAPKAKAVRLVKYTSVFYLVSFTFAGVLLMLIYLGSASPVLTPVVQNGIFYFDIPLGSLLLASALSYGVIALSQAIFKRNKTIGIRSLKIILSGRECTVPALSDTGNLLRDPISSVPVIIAEQKFIDTLFPEGIPSLEMAKTSSARLRLIPYSSLGSKGGMMTGFIPDEVRIDGRKTGRVIVAISPDALSKEDEYNALFNPNIIV